MNLTKIIWTKQKRLGLDQNNLDDPHLFGHKEGQGQSQRYTYRVLQTIQMNLMLLWVWAEWAV